MPHARAGSVAIDYDDLGHGEPMLLVMPGWCASRKAFDRFAPLLAQRHRTLAMDFRGQGRSGKVAGDFGFPQLVEDALAVVAASGARRVVPVATSHGGWVAVELRRRLGPGRVPGLVLIDWLVTEAPAPLVEGLRAIQDPARWRGALDGLVASWLHGNTEPAVAEFVQKEMLAYGFEMWSRACREIEAAYAKEGSPLKALAALRPATPTLHVYAQPPDAGYLAAQQAFAATHPWFQVKRLDAKSHFPTIEASAAVAAEVEGFLARVR